MAQTIIYRLKVEGQELAIKNQEELGKLVKFLNDEFKRADFGSTKYKELQQEIAKVKTIQKDVRDETRKLGLEHRISADRGKRSYNALQAELVNLKKEYKKLGQAEREASNGQQLENKIRSISSELKALDRNLGDNFRNVGNYQDAISSALGGQSALLDGVLSIAAGGGVLAIADIAVQGAQAIAQYVGQVNEEIRNLQGSIQALTGATGKDLDRFTVRLDAIASTFEVDENELLLAANALTEQLTGDFDESLRLIEQGYLAGADASGEFLDILKEYPTFFAEAQLSGDEFLNLITQQVRDGIFNDKGIDVIKEVTLRLRELTPATRDALNAIGLESTEVERLIAEEGIGAAIRAVSAQLRELRDDSPIVGQALADIFGGPGEDAGLEFLRSLADINGETDSLIDNTNELTQLQIRQLEAQERLSKSQLALKNSSADLNAEWSVARTRLKQLGTDFLTLVNVSFRSNNIIETIRDFRRLKKSVNETTQEVVGLDEFLNTAGLNRPQQAPAGLPAPPTRSGGGQEQAAGLNLDSLKERQKQLREEVTRAKLANEDYTESLREYNAVTEQIAGVNELFSTSNRSVTESLKKQREELEKQAQEGSLEFLNNKLKELNAELNRESDQNVIQQKIKEIIALEDQIDGVKTQLEGARSILGDDSVGDALQDEVDRLLLQETLKLGRDAQKEKEELAKQEIESEKDKNDAIIEAEKEKQEQLKLIREQAELERQQLADAGIQFAIGSLTAIADAALAIEQERLEQRRELQLEALEAEFEERFDAISGNTEQEEQLQRQLEEKKKVIEQEANAERKKIAVKQSLINTALSIGNALATVQPFFPAAVAAAAVAAVRGAAQTAVIKNQSFAEGGYTGPGKGHVDRTGFRQAGIVHQDEYVVPKRVLFSPEGSSLVSRLESLRTARGHTGRSGRGSFAEGGFTSLASAPDNNGERTTVLNSSVRISAGDVAMIAEAVREGSRQGSERGSSRGITEAEKIRSRRISLNQKLEN